MNRIYAIHKNLCQAMLLVSAVFMSTTAPLAEETASHGVVVSGAYLREPLPGRDVTAGYLSLTNQTTGPLTLIAVSSNGIRKIELHTHTRVGDMLRMRPIPHVHLPPGSQVTFEPGGRHLMIFGIAPRPTHGDLVNITLHFDRAPDLPVTFTTRSLLAQKQTAD